MPSFQNKNLRRVVLLCCCSLLVGAGAMTVAARSRTKARLKFEIKTVDSVTGKPKSKYVLGETVSVVFTLTNQDSRARTITKLEDTGIRYDLVSMFEHKDRETHTGWRGGTFRAQATADGIYWTESEPRMMTLAPGQSVSVKTRDLRTTSYARLGYGNYTLTATYLDGLKATVSFRIVINEAKSIPLLENIAENGDESDRSWANRYLEELKLPSLTGLVTDADGKPLKDVEISVTGPEEYSGDTRSNGRYYLSELTRGGTYTLTPSLTWDGKFDVEYTFEPASRTITNLNSKLTGLNFKATRVRPSTNVAEQNDGTPKARASSTFIGPADEFEPDNVLDGNESTPWDQCCNAAWVDGTPNKYPDWIEITLKEPTAIDWINVFSPRDNPEREDDVTLNETFTRNGIIDFDVQYWNGRVWQNVPGGAIRGNRNVWRKIAFPTVTTDKIRVVVRKALSGYSKIMEIEVFHINDAPMAKLTGRSRGRAESHFQFYTNALDRDRGVSKYTLNFGDGTPDYVLEYGDKPAIKQLNLTHTHKYEKAGTYTVTLRVMDHDGEGSETAMTVTVTDPPIPPFWVNKTGFQGIVGEAVVFEGHAPSDPVGKNVHYYWDFGDGALGAGATASHKYTAPGTYGVIVLIVDEDDGYRMRYLAPVVITAAPRSQQ